MVRLVDDLLDVSRIIARHDRAAPRADGPARRVAQRAWNCSAPLVEARRHDAAACDCREEPLPVDADPVRLAQVFGNLLNNAAKYGRPGGRIDGAAPRRRRSARGARCVDNGIGIDPDVLPHVFELFTQGRRDATARRTAWASGWRW